jgi:hypothetical protein
MAGKKTGTKRKANDDYKNEDSASNWMSIFFTVAIGNCFKDLYFYTRLLWVYWRMHNGGV